VALVTEEVAGLVEEDSEDIKLSTSYAHLKVTSARHGGHQVAQKLISTVFPRKSLRVTWLPSRSTRVKSGAGLSYNGGRRQFTSL